MAAASLLLAAHRIKAKRAVFNKIANSGEDTRSAADRARVTVMLRMSTHAAFYPRAAPTSTERTFDPAVLLRPTGSERLRRQTADETARSAHERHDERPPIFREEIAEGDGHGGHERREEEA